MKKKLQHGLSRRFFFTKRVDLDVPDPVEINERREDADSTY